jgi:hypothetical protein
MNTPNCNAVHVSVNTSTLNDTSHPPLIDCRLLTVTSPPPCSTDKPKISVTSTVYHRQLRLNCLKCEDVETVDTCSLTSFIRADPTSFTAADTKLASMNVSSLQECISACLSWGSPCDSTLVSPGGYCDLYKAAAPAKCDTGEKRFIAVAPNTTYLPHIDFECITCGKTSLGFLMYFNHFDNLQKYASPS